MKTITEEQINDVMNKLGYRIITEVNSDQLLPLTYFYKRDEDDYSFKVFFNSQDEENKDEICMEAFLEYKHIYFTDSCSSYYLLDEPLFKYAIECLEEISKKNLH